MEELREVVESGPVVVSVGGLRLVEVVWRPRGGQTRRGTLGPRQYDSASSPRGVSEPPRRRRACAAGSASGSARRAAHWLGSTSLPALGAAVSVDAHLAVERGTNQFARAVDDASAARAAAPT